MASTTREKLEKATADWLAFIEEVNGKSERTNEDYERMTKHEEDVNGLLALVKADDSAQQARQFVESLAGKAATNGDELDVTTNTTETANGVTLGDAFTKSDVYTGFVGRYARSDGTIPDDIKGVHSGPWHADVEVKDLITGGSATSAGAAVRDDRYPALTDLVPGRELLVVNLLTQARTTSDTVEFVRVTSKTNNASGVAEATATTGTSGTKPESALALETVTVTVRTIAHWIPISNRAAADAPQVRDLVDTFLRQGLAERLEQQVVSGAGTSQDFTGILNTTGRLTQAAGTVEINAIMQAIRQVRVTGRRRPNGIIVHPDDWYSTRFLARADTNGNYLIGDPRASLDQLNQLWGLRVVVSEAVPAGTGIVADFRQGVLFTREGVSLAVSDSHSDFFTRNILAVRAEMRAAFAVLDPEAFVEVTGLGA